MNGYKRNLVIALVVVVLVAAAYTFIGSPEFGRPQARLGGFMEWRQPVTFSGSGTSKTPTQGLIGPYKVTWTAMADSDAGCHLDARLRIAGRGGLGEFLVDETIEDSGPRTGQINVDTLSGGGGFYIDAASGCSWEFRFDPS